jgi:hypothetical protein
MNYTKKSWENTNKLLNEINDIYSTDETYELLKFNDYYKELFGKAKNRTLIKDNPKLYKSIYSHSNVLKDTLSYHNRNPQMWSFTNRIKFIVELNYNIEQLRCDCGNTYTWNVYCRKCPAPKQTWLGKTHSKTTKNKQRVAAVNYIKKQNGQIQPRYNIDSISIINEYGMKHGYNFQHAENGGEYYIKELGYFLDAYDLEKNVVLEIDEPHHFRNGKLRKKDIIRQEEITNFLGCKFIRKKI